MRVWVVLSCLAGCGRLAFDPLAGGTADALNGDGPRNLTCTTETFTANMKPPAWSTFAGSGCATQFTGGQLQISLAPSVDCYAGATTDSHDFTGGSLTAEVPVVTFGLNSEAYVEIHLDSANVHVITYSEGEILFIRRLNGINDVMTRNGYSANGDRWWRLVHFPETDEINYFTSPDGAIWMPRFTASTGFGVSALSFEAGAGTYNGGDPAPGAPIFDNFTYCVQ